MVEFLEYVKYQECLHLFDLPIPIIHEKEVRDFYYASKFSEDSQGVSTMHMVLGSILMQLCLVKFFMFL